MSEPTAPIPPPSAPLRRRGLCAAAAALLAGLLARATGRADAQTNPPLTLNTTNNSTSPTELRYNGTPASAPTLVVRNPGYDGIQSIASGSLSYGVLGDNAAGFGVVGTSATNVGVSGGSASGTGVSGDSNTGWGVAGYTDAPGTATVGGVYGASTAAGSSAYGVYGTATNGPGVYGTSTGNTYGVQGYSAGVAGVYGHTQTGAGVFGDTNSGQGVFGRGYSGAGVYATSTSGYGIFATTGTAPTIYSQATGGNTAVQGEANTGYAIYGHASGTNGKAAYFNGDVIVNGSFTVINASLKNVAVAFPDGSLRRLYCVESPENWFEDFGGGVLSNGRATVALDPDFATTIQTDNYRVFLTAEGPSNGLYISGKTATGFTVQEQGNGTSNVPFSYRVVGKRKDVVAPRLERIVVQPPPPVPPPPPPPSLPSATTVTTAGDARPGAPATTPVPPPVQPPNRSPRR